MTFESQKDLTTAEMRKVVQMRLFRAGARVQKAVFEKLQNAGQVRTGRTYFVPGTKTKYTASAPGEPPAWRTGTLARSYRLEPNLPSQIGTEILVGSELDYSVYLEKGTIFMEAREHLFPAYKSVEAEVRSILEGKA